MLKSHMDAVESALVVISKIPDNSGHSLHKGTPREAFIREFLQSHLPENMAFGTGEIIDANSKPGQQRNQFDIVIYRKSYPKLDFGGGVNGFLIESVIAPRGKEVLSGERLSTLVNPDPTLISPRNYRHRVSDGASELSVPQVESSPVV